MPKRSQQAWRADLRPDEAAQLAALDRDIAKLDKLRAEMAAERRVIICRVANRMRGRVKAGVPLGGPDRRYASSRRG